ncbi:hypothetical protein ABIF86_008281 [Bradyrhizobium japonicum]
MACRPVLHMSQDSCGSSRIQAGCDSEIQSLCEDLRHLGGRTFFSPGRPLRFEIDGIALLGVSLAARSASKDLEGSWLADLLQRSSQETGLDEWHQGLIKLARAATGEYGIRVTPPELAVAAAARGLGDLLPEDVDRAWKVALDFGGRSPDPGRVAVLLAVVEKQFAHLDQVRIGSATRQDLTLLLQNLSRGMKRWSFEQAKRTAKSRIARWEIENEYHVQNLLWAVLAPIFPDLDDEENFPSIGHKKPRADLVIPSLRTIIEVKFLRDRGQRGCANIIEEIAADTALYLSRTKEYDNIIAFVWDDCAQTEHHHELKQGIERLAGISAGVVLPRPSHMVR